MNSPPPQEPRSPRRVDLDRFGWALAAYSAVGYLVCFWRLGAARVIQMEGMVADGARHLVASGEWWVPKVYGEIYTFKPALAYWLAGLAYRLTDPPEEWLLRLPFAASIFALGLAALLWVRPLAGNRPAALCAMASVSGIVVVEKVRLAEFDGLLTAGVGVAIVAACHNLAAPRARLGVWLVGYLGLTFGFLAKGVPALMFYPPGVLVAALAARRFRRLLNWRHLAAATLFALLVGGYLAAAYRSAGAAAFEQPLAESRVRGLGWLEAQPDADERAAKLRQGEFVLAGDEADVARRPLVALGRSLAKPLLIGVAFLPWTLVLPWVRSRRLTAGLGDTERLLLRSAGAFLLAGVVVSMAVPTHAMRYYMPLAAPAGLLAGLLLGSRRDGAGPRRLIQLARGLALVASTLALAGALLFDTPPVSAVERALLGLVGLLTLTAILRVGRCRPGDRLPALMTLAAIALIAVNTLGIQARKAARRDLSRQAAQLADYLPPDGPVWVLGPSDIAGKNSSLLFYLRREVLAFRLAGPLPPPGSYCIVPSDRLPELAPVPSLVWEPLGRIEHHARDFLVGRCSGRDDPTESDPQRPGA